MTIILLDDNHEERQQIAARIEEDGHTVLQAETAADAMRIRRLNDVGLVVVDMLLEEGEFTAWEFMLCYVARGHSEDMVALTRDPRSVLHAEIKQLAGNLGAKVVEVMPRDDAIRVLPKAVNTLARAGVLKGEGA